MWLTSAIVLLVVSAWMPTTALWVALLLGGSSSHALESVTRGFISDYICLRFWPPFNIGDVAISTGGIGVLVTMASQILDW
jgi:lipoprotein signal peptidase